jgi:2-polyprenyl-6-methoxyphenol hydroxylase-like FAD-dependent oxidoreductase
VTVTAATQSDCVVVGASFAGLACATALARAGMSGLSRTLQT